MRRRLLRRGLIVLALAGLATFVAGAAVARAFDPGYEAKDFSKTQERSAIFSTPEYQLRLRQQSSDNWINANLMQAKDPERN
ncbi:MAG: hypothetical protein ACJ75Z_04570, partial [Solirubrobacterales bacterium]